MNEQGQGQMAPGQGLQELIARIDEIGQMVAEIHSAVVSGGAEQGGGDNDEALRQEALARLMAQKQS